MDFVINSDLKAKILPIKVLVTDVDGVLTDAGIYLDPDGNELFGKFNIQDGYGVVIAQECNLPIVVLSGRKSLCTEARCRNLGIQHYYTGIKDKHSKLVEILDELDLSLGEAAYIGDDVIDLKAMNSCGLKIAPRNARNIIKETANYITSLAGGEGALREAIDLILETQGVYATYLDKFK